MLIHMTILELSTNLVFVSLNCERKLEQPEQNPKRGQGECANSSRKCPHQTSWFKSRIVFDSPTSTVLGHSKMGRSECMRYTEGAHDTSYVIHVKKSL